MARTCVAFPLLLVREEEGLLLGTSPSSGECVIEGDWE